MCRVPVSREVPTVVCSSCQSGITYVFRLTSSSVLEIRFCRCVSHFLSLVQSGEYPNGLYRMDEIKLEISNHG